MDFLRDLEEGRMTRDANDARKLTYTDCKRNLYLTMLCLEMLRQFPKYAKSAVDYARRSSGYRNYSKFRPASTDMYNFMYFVNGDETAISKLKDPEAAARERASTNVPLRQIHFYIATVGTGNVPSNVIGTFASIERAFGIENTTYKSMRRRIINFSSLNGMEKRTAATNLILAARTHLRASDIIDDLSKAVAEFDLESTSIKDNNPTVSSPDIGFDDRDLLLYRYIVGAKNLAQTRLFLKKAQNGESIPSTAVKAYQPAVKMLNDIVQAGPGFVQQLRLLHTRSVNKKK
tara:strand:+ start:2675 stop:3544 length:870 start_codon:yes stop_codon:yes gene_type:complete